MSELKISTKKAKLGAEIIVKFCGQLRKDDRALIIFDSSTEKVAKHLLEAAERLCPTVRCMKLPQGRMHGAEPPKKIATAMLKSTIIFAATKFSLVHTLARFKATKNGARYLSLPDYSMEQLCSPSLTADFISIARKAKKIAGLFESCESAHITTKAGTNIFVKFHGRKANFCPGFCPDAGMLGSPPDIETNIAPLERGSDGVLVVDGSIPCREIGLVKKPITVEIKRGRIVSIRGSSRQVAALQKLFHSQKNEKAFVLAEFGIGLNPKARLMGFMLEDEGCLGTAHFGFGSNSTIGGLNDINFHLDFVIKNPTIRVGSRFLMKNGKLIGI